MAAPAEQASRLQPKCGARGGVCDRCAVGAVPRRGRLRVRQPELWSRAGALAAGQAARALYSDASVAGWAGPQASLSHVRQAWPAGV